MINACIDTCESTILQMHCYVRLTVETASPHLKLIAPSLKSRKDLPLKFNYYLSNPNSFIKNNSWF